jgi:dolichol-phosphate mannosyltransferase
VTQFCTVTRFEFLRGKRPLSRPTLEERDEGVDAMSYIPNLGLSLIIPTYNERENIEAILDRLVHALEGRRYEIIVVDDDSTDRTWELVETLSSRTPAIRLERRRGKKRDLALSIMEGFGLAQSDILGCMDADGSHPPEAISQLLEKCEDGVEMVVGSRYIAGGSISGWPLSRHALSWAATIVTRLLLGLPIRDPLSGFFVLHRGVYERARNVAKPRGFKVLLELYVRGQPSSVMEIPIHFDNRRAGRSKLSAKVLYQGVAGVISLMIARLTA